MFHRQAASSSNVLTVGVQVVATIDPSGNTVVQGTVTNAVPSVPAVPTVPLPSVPSVPAFPSDLTVPAYPWPSGVSVSTGQSTTQPASSIPLSITLSGATTPLPTLLSSSSAANSTSTISSKTRLPFHRAPTDPFPGSTSSSSFFFATTSTRSSTSRSSTSTSTSSRLSSSSSSTSTSSSRLSASLSSSSLVSTSASATAAAFTSAGPGGGGGGANPASTAASPTGTNAVTGAAADNDGPLGTPQVVGSVVGSLAGAAILLALILFLLRRHKQKQRGGALQLSGADVGDNQPIASSGQQMATRSSVVPSSAVAFFNRFSGASRSTADTSTTAERGFQRISGRKLPSAFSEGMTSEQFARGQGTLSGSSFYTDDQGFYGGPGDLAAAAAANKEFGKETGEPSATGAMGRKERIMPSPARTPVIHHPDDAPTWGTSRNGGGSTLSPPVSPNPDHPAIGTLGRSHPSHDGSRSSRFTENV
ncbi:hypothetical protein K491DRAFT_704146 [Lophiostoma macrostomum CBS 122681]|uniref:Uncharacterized protein n=1 Tax=Lophiostoma macrostomum CBS 122681 TaxID=1314788 RepID=A0A6A6T8M8_9PLEO|nr:hypothetical protein K491DRAFT_704146 [Lophiostoma macrostomum CBS 122681]